MTVLSRSILSHFVRVGRGRKSRLDGFLPTPPLSLCVG
ncbi:hypothetical protein HMPREF1136_0374 [Actinomyces sp. ICM47]|nr:hypothetical protein HMPREF1136_0374 [Actinomyces sp. ICM47]